MNKPANFQVASAARFAAAFVTFAAAVSCSHTSSTVPPPEQRADAGVPMVEDAGVSARDAAVRDASTTPRTITDAASRAPSVDAQADLCAGTICVAPAHCDTSAGFALCVCPAGMKFVDLGGSHSPCQAIHPGTSAEDSGDAADGG